MGQDKDEIRDALLSRLRQPSNLPAYREEVTRLIEKNEKAFRRERWGVGALWLFVVVLATAFLVAGGERIDSPRGAWFGTMSCFLFLFGAVELLKHFINRARVELLKEVKQVQVQILELQALLGREPSQ